MSKKAYTLHVAQFQNHKSFHLLGWIESTRVVKSLANLYSKLLDERVSAHRTLKLVHAQLALGCFLLLGSASVLLSLLLLAWTFLAIWQCKI